MLEARKVTVKSSGSCQFCERGDLNMATGTIKRPYHKVWLITSDSANGGVFIRMCDDCKKILKEIK